MSQSATPSKRQTPPTPIPLDHADRLPRRRQRPHLLNRLAEGSALADTAVIINEFGEVALDHLLVEYVGDNMVLLQSGCLCCTMRGDLVDALETLLRDLDNRRCTFQPRPPRNHRSRRPRAAPAYGHVHPYLLLRYRLDGVVTQSTPSTATPTLDAHAERSSRRPSPTGSC